MKHYLVFIFGIVSVCNGAKIGTEVFQDIYNTCLSKYSVGCVKPKALAWISDVVSSNEIRLTNDLSIIRTGNDQPIDFNGRGRGNVYVELFDKIDGFISTHNIKMAMPEWLKSPEARSLVDFSNEIDSTDSLEMPLSDGNVAEGIFINSYTINNSK